MRMEFLIYQFPKKKVRFSYNNIFLLDDCLIDVNLLSSPKSTNKKTDET